LVLCGSINYTRFEILVNLIGSISSDVIGWCYKTFQSVLGLRTKEEEAMPLIYILQNGTIVEFVTSSMNEALHKVPDLKYLYCDMYILMNYLFNPYTRTPPPLPPPPSSSATAAAHNVISTEQDSTSQL
jgi:hypothetical protein